eukprot:7971238-Pyramimonas_sp.AAC.1
MSQVGGAAKSRRNIVNVKEEGAQPVAAELCGRSRSSTRGASTPHGNVSDRGRSGTSTPARCRTICYERWSAGGGYFSHQSLPPKVGCPGG